MRLICWFCYDPLSLTFGINLFEKMYFSLLKRLKLLKTSSKLEKLPKRLFNQPVSTCVPLRASSQRPGLSSLASNQKDACGKVYLDSATNHKSLNRTTSNETRTWSPNCFTSMNFIEKWQKKFYMNASLRPIFVAERIISSNWFHYLTTIWFSWTGFNLDIESLYGYTTFSITSSVRSTRQPWIKHFSSFDQLSNNVVCFFDRVVDITGKDYKTIIETQVLTQLSGNRSKVIIMDNAQVHYTNAVIDNLSRTWFAKTTPTTSFLFSICFHWTPLEKLFPGSMPVKKSCLKSQRILIRSLKPSIKFSIHSLLLIFQGSCRHMRKYLNRAYSQIGLYWYLDVFHDWCFV